MIRTLARLCIVLLVLVLAPGLAPGASAAPNDDFPTTPAAKPDGSKWRLGYLEGGPYSQYPATLIATVKGLVDLDWLKPLTFPEDISPEDAHKLWEYLARNADSEYIEFAPDAFWSGNWDEAPPREQLRAEVIERLNKGDIDLMIAMGTWAGQDLATSEVSTPTVVLSSSDPLGSGIVKSADDSGLDHLNARLDPTRYLRQVRLFHDIIGFKRLGIVYEDTMAGRTYAALDDVKTVAAERGFEVVPCTTMLDVHSGEAFRNLQTCLDELAPKVDAMYLTENNGMQLDKFPELLAPLFANDVPTFSMAGSDEVRHGVLLSIAQAGFKYVGDFHAKTIAKILNGATPRLLTQVFEAPPKIAINLKTAERIGFDPPVDILMAADEIYENIEEAPPAK